MNELDDLTAALVLLFKGKSREEIARAVLEATGVDTLEVPARMIERSPVFRRHNRDPRDVTRALWQAEQQFLNRPPPLHFLEGPRLAFEEELRSATIRTPRWNPNR